MFTTIYLALQLQVGIYTLPCVTVYPDHQEKALLLAKTIYSEAGNQSEFGQLAVGNVVLNRMDYFEQPLKKIIYAPNQFNGVYTKYFRRTPPEDVYNLAVQVLSGYRPLDPDIMYFANTRIATNKKWLKIIKDNKAFTYQDHTFYSDPHVRMYYKVLNNEF
jgi:spore germination cell wall hydrolase CwlJ-like protein